jgi:hypothetical protein
MSTDFLKVVESSDKIEVEDSKNTRLLGKIRVLSHDLVMSCFSDGLSIELLSEIPLSEKIRSSVEDFVKIRQINDTHVVEGVRYINRHIKNEHRAYVSSIIRYITLIFKNSKMLEGVISSFDDGLELTQYDQSLVLDYVDEMNSLADKLREASIDESEGDDPFEVFSGLMENVAENPEPFFVLGDKTLDKYLTSYEALKVLLISPSGNGKTTMILNILNNTRNRKHLFLSIESTGARILDGLIQLRCGLKIEELRLNKQGICQEDKDRMNTELEDIAQYEDKGIATLAGIERAIVRYFKKNNRYPDNLYLDHVGLIEDFGGQAGRMTLIFERLKDLSKKYNISTFILGQASKDFVKDDFERDRYLKINETSELRYKFNGFSGMFGCVKPEVSFDLRIDMQSMDVPDGTLSAIAVRKCRNHVPPQGNIMMKRLGMKYTSEANASSNYEDMSDSLKDFL